MLQVIDVVIEYATVNWKMMISDNGKLLKIGNRKQPMSIHKYNAVTNRVDKSDQILNTNSLLRKCVRWQKTFIFLYDRYSASQWLCFI